MAELADAVAAVVVQQGGPVKENAVEACRREGRAGSVQELGDCVHEHTRLTEAADAVPPRRRRPGAWADFLRESGDLLRCDGEAISEEEKVEDATLAITAPPREPRSIAEKLLRG